MKNIGRMLALFVVIFSLLTQVRPCGPSYITPIFEYENAPENPYENFAAGDLGIIKSTFHRPVLFAAYRYITGGSFTPDEQKALVQVWEADFDNKDYLDTDITDAVRTWVEKRKDVAGKDEKVPDIYVERNYGLYNFFPNCTKNAFETATETLADRVAAHGPNDPGVVSWLKGQDEVFTNCSSGKQIPEQAPPGSPDWLQKDRDYQIAAAAFYSLDYEEAKRRFALIAKDFDSPWRETADYLVARTLIRQASLTKDKERSTQYYSEAEQKLQSFTSGKFADSAERLLGLVKYRIHPKQRVGELARKLMQGGNQNFRQDLIDYAWLVDKLEADVLDAEDKRKEKEDEKNNPKNTSANEMTGAEYANRLANSANNETNTAASNSNSSEFHYHNGPPKVNDDDIQISVYSDDSRSNWSFYVRANATDEEAIAEAEKLGVSPLTEEIKNRIREARRDGYAQRYTESKESEYKGYQGPTKMSLSLMPNYLRSEELTEWIFTYQMKDEESYLYSLSKFRAGGGDLWLMTALSKADRNSTQLISLLNGAERVAHSSPAYQTIAYHRARLLLELGKNVEAKKLLDDILDGPDQLTVSARNQFMSLRLKFADSLDNFLKYSLRKPFAFDFDGETGTIQQFMENEKKWYDPKNNEGKTREQYDQEIEDRFKNELLWQDQLMFDTDTITLMNDKFPLSVLMQVEQSPAIPDYMRDRFAGAIWTRAILLQDNATAAKIAPALIRYHPEFADLMSRVTNAKTPTARENAILFFILKNPVLSPYVEDGIGRSDNEQGQFDADDWWCAFYATESDESGDTDAAKKPGIKLTFLTPVQVQSAKAEQAKLKEIGDAPQFLGNKVMEWAKRSPLDRRIPESLYIVYEANGWTKYGCGNNEELRGQIGEYLKRHYPHSEWTQKIVDEEKDGQ